jgi:hypothetical protein
MSVPRPASLRKLHRRQDRRNAAKARVLEAMRNGAALHLCHRMHRKVWALSTGEFITYEAAIDTIRDPHVVGVGDSLFGPELSQTFRYVGDEK